MNFYVLKVELQGNLRRNINYTFLYFRNNAKSELLFQI